MENEYGSDHSTAALDAEQIGRYYTKIRQDARSEFDGI